MPLFSDRMTQKIVAPARQIKQHIGRWLFPPLNTRRVVAARWLSGEGIEIGALHNPLPLPKDLRIQYVDRMTVDELRREFPDLESLKLTPVDIVDDGESLTKFANESLDFVIANHFIEHCEDPIGTLLNQLRVLRPGGRLFLTVPDKRFTFDKDRPVTPLAHLVEDFQRGAAWSRAQHYDEWVRMVVKKSGEEQIRTEAERLMRIRQNIHFHVWTAIDFLEVVQWLRSRQSLEINALDAEYELVIVLKKTA